MPERPDLAASAARLSRALIHAEGPILEHHGLTMWAYVVLVKLGTSAPGSQGELADAIGADRTRIIAVLDDLQERGLITRDLDPDDRRIRLVALTPRGRRLRDATQSEIQRNERRLLNVLPAAERAGFLRQIEHVADAASDITPNPRE